MSDIKLKYYLPEDLEGIPAGKNMLTINKNGCFSPSKALIMHLDLKPGKNILLAQNENAPKEWFLTLSPKGFAIRKKSKSDVHAVTFTNKKLYTIFMKSIGMEFKTTRFIVAKDPIEIQGEKCYAIITSSGKSV